MVTKYALIVLSMALFLICGFTFTTYSYALKEDKTLSNGWVDILDIQEEIFTRFETIEDATRAFEEEMHGRKVRFSGYLKQLSPHFEKEKDYYLTAEIEDDCLPFYQSECCYCGRDNPDYIRVLFNGSGKENKDLSILLSPHRNRYFKEKGTLKEIPLDNGNYKIYIYDKRFDLEANIRMCSVSCKSTDCEERYITVHLDRWEFLNIDKK